MRRVLGIGCCVMLLATGCAFNGLNSLPLPGTQGRGSGASVYHVEIANVGTLEANSPVMIDDVIVGSIKKLSVPRGAWYALVDVSVNPGVAVPANAVASVGQTSLLGSMHLALNTPLGQPPNGRLQPGATIPLNRSSTYPSTEATLSSLSVILNAGGLGQIGDIIHNFGTALSGHTDDVRDLLGRLDKFIGVLNDQRGNLVASIQALNRLGATVAGQRDVITQALDKIPPALDVLIKERPRITTALNKLGTFSNTATRLVNDAGNDLVKNLQNLGPALGALADVGPELDQAIALAPIFPYGQAFIDRYLRGDFVNGYFIIDLTNSALRKSILRGTHWERMGAESVPVPGDPEYLQFRHDAPPGAPGGFDPMPGPVGEPLRGVNGSAWQPGVPTPNAGPIAGPLPGPPPAAPAPVNPQSADAPPLPGPPPPAAAPGPPADQGAPVPGMTPATTQPTDGTP
jgi:phospholipid/cholesterol/gamma-HCH transport system substrate-binding protein